jgi:GAF domain-containing protein
MNDLDQIKTLTHSLEPSAAKTAELPGFTAAVDKKAEEFRAGQGKILGMIAANAPLAEILNRLVLLIEAQSPGMLCSVLLLSEDGDHIRHGAAPSLPDDYVKAIDGAPIGPKNGSCGTAMYRGEPVIVKDILADPLWEDYRHLASASGLRACWSTPILSGRGKVLGSFAMYYRQPQTPTGEEASLTEVATQIAGLAIENKKAREVLQRTQAELAQATWRAARATQGASRSPALSTDEVSIAPKLTAPLESIVNNAEKCLQWLDENQPVSRLREALTEIASEAHKTLEIARTQSSAKK